MKPFDPASEGTEEDGNGEKEAAAEEEPGGTAEGEQRKREGDWFDEYMKPINPDEEEMTQEHRETE